MDKSLALLTQGLESSSETTAEWTKFSNQFKRDITEQIKQIDGTLTGYNKGHFYISGFLRTKDDACYYFSTSDLRGVVTPSLLIRTAKNEKDYTGGNNNYITWTHGMFAKLPS